MRVVVIERDSPRDRLVATFFFLIVMGLLLYSAIRSRLVSIIFNLKFLVLNKHVILQAKESCCYTRTTARSSRMGRSLAANSDSAVFRFSLA